MTLGGSHGPGEQPFPDFPSLGPYVGTMTSNQSIYDPVFWLHHGNVERQFMSWKNIWFEEDGKTPKFPNLGSIPPKDLQDRVLYPFTKPEKLENGHTSYNTDSSAENDGSFADWFFTDVPYEYDEYIVPTDWSPKSLTEKLRVQRELIVTLPKAYRSGEFTLFLGDEKITTLSYLSGVGSGSCANCETKGKDLVFLVEDLEENDFPDLSIWWNYEIIKGAVFSYASVPSAEKVLLVSTAMHAPSEAELEKVLVQCHSKVKQKQKMKRRRKKLVA